jgi:hypothetical protein
MSSRPMTGPYYDQLTALPALGEPGAPPPLTGAALLARVADTPAGELVAVVLLEDDLHLRDTRLAGAAGAAGGAGGAGGLAPAEAPAVLTAAQVDGREALPYPLSTPAEGHLIAADAVWAAYYRHAAATARALESPFLAAWVEAEVGLRNALATARARALGLDAGRYLVAPELSGPGWEPVVAEWAAAADPLAGWRVLLLGRWRWLKEHDGWFTFGADELAAYAAGLALLRRWQRVLGTTTRTGMVAS